MAEATSFEKLYWNLNIEDKENTIIKMVLRGNFSKQRNPMVISSKEGTNLT